MDGKPRILIVEDNIALSGVVRFNLMRAGFEVVVANDGEIGLNAILNQPTFDLIITDHQMPGITGLELCKHVRGLDDYRSVPIILLTAKQLELDIQQIQNEYGLSAVVAKPFSPARITSQIQELLTPVK